MADLLKAIILGIVEGVTEFLPVSSTGHLLLCQRWMGLDLDDGFWSMFAIFIQIGAIAAVVVFFRERILGLLRGQPERLLTPLEISQSARAGVAKGAVGAGGGGGGGGGGVGGGGGGGGRGGGGRSMRWGTPMGIRTITRTCWRMTRRRRRRSGGTRS